MASQGIGAGIGATLQRQRVNQRVALEQIARQTRIPLRHLEAIEAEEFDRLPGLVFARNFVRQYAVILGLDPEPLLANLPKLDESRVQLPNPPADLPRTVWDGSRNSAVSSAGWLVLALGAAIAAYVHFNHTPTSSAGKNASPVLQSGRPASTRAVAEPVPQPQARSIVKRSPAPPPEAPAAHATLPASPAERPVQVVVTAHDDVWVQMTADDKAAFTGTLKPNETREIRADEQVKILAGNAGGLTVSLNGKTLEPIGSPGEVRFVRLTAEGPQFLPRNPQPVFDPL